VKLPDTTSELEGPNLTPVIDVVFLLLIFFFVTTKFADDLFDIETRVPQVVKARPVATGHRQIVVDISAHGRFKFNGKTCSQAQLQALLTEERTKNPNMQAVLIHADQRTQWRFPAAVMGYCEREQIPHSCAVRMGGEEGVIPSKAAVSDARAVRDAGG
jgi:biopolymer transport protein ExbD